MNGHGGSGQPVVGWAGAFFICKRSAFQGMGESIDYFILARLGGHVSEFGWTRSLIYRTGHLHTSPRNDVYESGISPVDENVVN